MKEEARVGHPPWKLERVCCGCRFDRARHQPRVGCGDHWWRDILWEQWPVREKYPRSI